MSPEYVLEDRGNAKYRQQAIERTWTVSFVHERSFNYHTSFPILRLSPFPIYVFWIKILRGTIKSPYIRSKHRLLY